MKTRRVWWPSLKIRPALAGALLVIAGTLIGLAVVLLPLAAWTMAGAALALLLLLAPPHVRIGAAVLAATGSRLLVATGYFPESLDFFHFPLVLLTALMSATEAKSRSSLRRALGYGLIALLAACLLSWTVNGGQPVRPLLDWLVFAEPFLLIYAIASMPSDPRMIKALWGLALALPFVQLPLAVYQAYSLGLADYVQGLFIGMGAGAHVAGGLTLVGSLICLARAVGSAKVKAGSFWLLGGVVLFLVAVLADAKQVIIAFFPSLLFMLLGLVRMKWSRAVLALPALAGIILGAFSYYQPLQMVLDWTLISRGVLGKAEAFAVIASRLSSSASGWIFGLGPGNTVSRVALMGLGSFVKPGSPVYLLGLKPALTTIELWNLTTSSWLFSSSSVWSSVSSWLGLLGDLGLVGFGLYLWMCLRIWQGISSKAVWQTRLARAVLLMCGLLGFMFSWLEEPGFTMPASLVAGLGLVIGQAREAEGAE
jgi:hypothetical protein